MRHVDIKKFTGEYYLLKSVMIKTTVDYSVDSEDTMIVEACQLYTFLKQTAPLSSHLHPHFNV
jgi:hypothetical protein